MMGLECAGVVESVGEGVTRIKKGDEVCALLAGGGYAEYVVVPAGQVLLKPRRLNCEQAASIPEVFATAYLNLFMEALATLGEYVLIHAGASGVGTAGIQMCKAFGNPCFVTVGSDQKLKQCLQLGAVAGCNRHDQRFEELIGEWTNGKGVDVILDPVGASYFKANLKSLNTEGRLILIGLMGGVAAEIPLGHVIAKRIRIVGSTLRARTISAKASIMDALYERVWPLLESKEIAPVIEAVFAIEDVDEAHQKLSENETVGKVVLRIV